MKGQKHSKMKNLNYNELKTQKYLLDPKTTVKTKQQLFGIRTRMEMFKHNYKGNYTSLYCPLCSTHPDSQEEAANCPEVKIETDDEERNTELYFKVF